MADPGFTRAYQPLRGASSYYLTNFSQKLHENEEIWARGASLMPLDPQFNLNRAKAMLEVNGELNFLNPSASSNFHVT